MSCVPWGISVMKMFQDERTQARKQMPPLSPVTTFSLLIPWSLSPGTHSALGYSTVTLLLFLWSELSPLKKVASEARVLLKDIYLQQQVY